MAKNQNSQNSIRSSRNFGKVLISIADGFKNPERAILDQICWTIENPKFLDPRGFPYWAPIGTYWPLLCPYWALLGPYHVLSTTACTAQAVWLIVPALYNSLNLSVPTKWVLWPMVPPKWALGEYGHGQAWIGSKKLIFCFFVAQGPNGPQTGPNGPKQAQMGPKQVQMGPKINWAPNGPRTGPKS